LAAVTIIFFSAFGLWAAILIGLSKFGGQSEVNATFALKQNKTKFTKAPAGPNGILAVFALAIATFLLIAAPSLILDQPDPRRTLSFLIFSFFVGGAFFFALRSLSRVR
jgi:hypothetical protein